MVVFHAMGLQARHQVAHALPEGQLAEEHTEHLVPLGKALDVPVAPVGLDDTVEDPSWLELGNLGEHIFTLVHGISCKNPIFRFKSSRHQKAPRIRYTKNFKELGLTFNAH